jgi:hypothetical protein
MCPSKSQERRHTSPHPSLIIAEQDSLNPTPVTMMEDLSLIVMDLLMQYAYSYLVVFPNSKKED